MHILSVQQHLMIKYACVGENFNLLMKPMLIYPKQIDNPFLGHDAQVKNP